MKIFFIKVVVVGLMLNLTILSGLMMHRYNSQGIRKDIRNEKIKLIVGQGYDEESAEKVVTLNMLE